MDWLGGLVRFLLKLSATFAVLSVIAYLILKGMGHIPAHISLLDFFSELLAVLWDRFFGAVLR